MSAKGTSFHGGLDASSPRNVSKMAISSILRQLLHSFNANFLFIDFCSKKFGGGRVGGHHHTLIKVHCQNIVLKKY